jgi:hypothetical protein
MFVFFCNLVSYGERFGCMLENAAVSIPAFQLTNAFCSLVSPYKYGCFGIFRNESLLKLRIGGEGLCD